MEGNDFRMAKTFWYFSKRLITAIGIGMGMIAGSAIVVTLVSYIISLAPMLSIIIIVLLMACFLWMLAGAIITKQP